ncbi:MAG: type IX secretion system membrane protein PorP/SprF [Chitinophagales bacterium]|jgi:type IX secretion system PorP/SprF family membrane protein|nr:type IX secretion system membrane protein PorP/SprF [Chitinophagales bacterium]
MKRILSILLLSLTIHTVQAQQLMNSSLYDLQGNLHNPAVAGLQQQTVLGASYRSMWSGIEGSPVTALVFGSTYLQKAKIGIGGYLYSDVTGPTSRRGIQTSYAYHIPMQNGAQFSVGLEARFQQFAIDKAMLIDALGNDPVMGGAATRFKGDAGLGVAYTSAKWQLGASVSQLIQSKLDFYTGNLQRNEEARLYRHFYLHGSYQWQVDANTRIIPNFLVIYLPNAPTELQAGARVEHRELFWWGLSLRARQSWMLSTGIKLQKKMTIGYSFDIYSTPLSVFDQGPNAHELLLRYQLSK